MRKFTLIGLALMLVVASCAKDKSAKDKSGDKSVASAKTEPTPTAATAPSDSAAKPGLYAENIQSVTATVEAIDQNSRMVTLRGPEGNTLTFQAGPEVRNLAQVQVGDRVNVGYKEALGIQVTKPGEPVNEVITAAGRAAPGEKPGAAGVQRTTITATVEAMDPAVPSVTLRGPAGNLRTIKVRDASRLQNVKIGDQVIFTYTEALAVSVEKAK